MVFTDISNMVVAIGRVNTNGVELLGTGFLLNKEGILATAAHVVNNNDNGLVLILNNVDSIQQYQDTTNHQVKFIKIQIVNVNPFADVCILKIIDNAKIKSNLLLSSTDDINVGEQVALFGYPHADHARMVLTQQNTYVGAKVKIDSSGIKSKNIILNIQCRPGQSGSPIVNLKDMTICAMIIGSYAPKFAAGGISIGGIDPQTLHQTTHAISAEYIKEMLE